MKLRISLLRMLGIAAIAYAIGALVLFLCFMQYFITLPWSATPWIIIMVYAALCVGLYIALAVNYYYVIERKSVIVKRLGKSMMYKFNEVIYINEALSEKKKMVVFVMKTGSVVYLTFDKQGILYKTMLEQCENLLSDEDFARAYRNIKF